MIRQLVAGMGLKGMKTTLKGGSRLEMETCSFVAASVAFTDVATDLEYLLIACDALEKPSAPLGSGVDAMARDESDEESDDSHAGGTNAARGGLRSAGKQVVEADDDSDFDL